MSKTFNIIIFLALCSLSYCQLPYNQNNKNWGVCVQPNRRSEFSHSVFLGCVHQGDKLLYNQTAAHSGKWFAIRSDIFRYPLPGYLRNETITGVWMFDNDTNGKGGYAKIVTGGVGYRQVNIELRGYGWGKGYNFLIQIFGV